MGFFLGCLGCTSGSQTKTDDRDFPKKVAVGDEAVAEAVEVVKRFSWAEIEKMTMNFKQVIGVGGYSTIYLAKFHDSSLGAIKIYISSERLNQVFKNELEISQKLHHANIVKLLGYCDDRDEGVLVYEYIPKGNLQEELHKNNEIPCKTPQNNKPNNLSPQNNKPNNLNPQKQKLSWKQRICIAYQLAQALEYLHENGDLHIVHGDIKSSNILLDEFYNCKLCDFGFSKMGFSSMIKPFCSSSGFPMMGSPGYMDPHYLMTGIASKKSDLYSYGVLLLEIITGFEPYVCSGVDKQVLLTSIVRTKDRFDVEKVVKMVDPWILNDEGFDIEQVKTMATIAGNCLHHLPSLRPSASNICKIIREMM